MFSAARTTEAVPVWRQGRLGVNLQRIQAPMQVLNGRATAPATNAQYPQPAQARLMEMNTERSLATISFAETSEKSIARLSRARCCTDMLVKKIEREIPTATPWIRASP